MARREGRAVYCFRPRGEPAVTDGLDQVFHADFGVSQTGTSAACEVSGIKPYADKFRPTTRGPATQHNREDSSEPRRRPPKLRWRRVRSESANRF